MADIKQKTTSFRPRISIRTGSVMGYGGPGYDWIRGVFDNRVLYEFTGGEGSIAVLSERQRVKWERSWPSEEAFRKAISKKRLEYPLCHNCQNPIGSGGSNCLDKYWCSREKCRDALETARIAYKQDEEARRLQWDKDQQRQKEERVHELNEATQCFHWKNGWYFKRLEDGSVRIMHRDKPDSDYLSTNLVISPSEWASIICSVSRDGETPERWGSACDFHGKIAE